MLSARNRMRLRRYGRRLFMRPRACHCRRGDCITLEQLGEGRSARVTCNNDLRTIERGLYQGVGVTILRNTEGEPNIVVAVGDSRYVLDRRIASLIRVRVD